MKIMKQNNGIVEIEEMQFNQTVSSLKNFAKQLNEKPHEGDDPLSLRALDRNGIVNESLCTLCLKLGLHPSSELLSNILNKSEENSTIIITEAFAATLQADERLPSIWASIKHANEPFISQFVRIGKVLTQSYNQLSHSIFQNTGKRIIVEDYISFENGAAAVSEHSLKNLKEVFTIRLDTPLRQEIYSLLSDVSEKINLFNAAITKANLEHGLIHGHMSIDESYLSEIDGSVVARTGVIKYF